MQTSWDPDDATDLSWAQVGRMAADWQHTRGAAIVELSRIIDVTPYFIELANGARFNRTTGRDTGKGKWHRNAEIRRADHPSVLDWVARNETRLLRVDLIRILSGGSVGAGKGPDSRETVQRRLREARARLHETEAAVAALLR